jgi:hypothetical protein
LEEGRDFCYEKKGSDKGEDIAEDNEQLLYREGRTETASEHDEKVVYADVRGNRNVERGSSRLSGGKSDIEYRWERSYSADNYHKDFEADLESDRPLPHEEKSMWECLDHVYSQAERVLISQLVEDAGGSREKDEEVLKRMAEGSKRIIVIY